MQVSPYRRRQQSHSLDTRHRPLLATDFCHPWHGPYNPYMEIWIEIPLRWTQTSWFSEFTVVDKVILWTERPLQESLHNHLTLSSMQSVHRFAVRRLPLNKGSRLMKNWIVEQQKKQNFEPSETLSNSKQPASPFLPLRQLNPYVHLVAHHHHHHSLLTMSKTSELDQ